MEIAQGVQIVAQLGAVGILLLIVYKIPSILKELREERQQSLLIIERQVEVHAREMASKSDECRKERQEMAADNRKQRDDFLSVISVFGKIDKVAEEAAEKVLADAETRANSLLKATEVMMERAIERVAHKVADEAAEKVLGVLSKK